MVRGSIHDINLENKIHEIDIKAILRRTDTLYQQKKFI
jgi:hypothetical protein